MSQSDTVTGDAGTIVIRARPTYRLLVRSRWRLFIRSSLPLTLVTVVVALPIVLSLLSARMQGVAWLTSSGRVLLIVCPTFAVLSALLSVFGGVFHPATKRFVRDGAEFAFDRDGMAARNDTFEGRFAWEACTSAVEVGGAFVLFVGANQWLLPYEDFAAGDVERFRGLVRQRLGTKAKLAG